MSSAELLHTAAPIKFLREPEVLDRTGLSATAIDLLEARGEFPRRIPLGARAVGWIEVEVVEWQRQRIALRDDVAARAGRTPPRQRHTQRPELPLPDPVIQTL
jgi:prophage regulatory protein